MSPGTLEEAPGDPPGDHVEIPPGVMQSDSPSLNVKYVGLHVLSIYPFIYLFRGMLFDSPSLAVKTLG
jgi:hypothetical protein